MRTVGRTRRVAAPGGHVRRDRGPNGLSMTAPARTGVGGGASNVGESSSDRAILDLVVGVAGVAAELVAGVAEGVTDVVAGVGDLVGGTFLAIGLAPRLLGLVVDVAHGFLRVGLHIFPVHRFVTSRFEWTVLPARGLEPSRVDVVREPPRGRTQVTSRLQSVTPGWQLRVEKRTNSVRGCHVPATGVGRHVSRLRPAGP